MTTHADDPHFLRLAFVRGVGSIAAHKLLSELGDISTVFDASNATLSRIVGDAVARKITVTPDDETQVKIDEALAWLNANADHHLLTWAHPGYPKALLESGDAPLVIYAKGRIELLSRRAIAMVGSRNCSQGGADTAEAFAQAFAERGVTVVSGMALGIDAASHVGALRAGSGKDGDFGSTIAVIGTGIDRVYPARNKLLAHSIAELGLMLSEYPLATPPLPANFPKRNRIISGLSLGVLVVEASMQSGSLITARFAGEQGREVFAIPGSIHSTFHKGCHHLIKQGAKLVETANDVLEELRFETVAATEETATETGARKAAVTGLLKFIEHTPIDVDTLVARSTIAVDQVVTELTMLELDGRIEQLPGGRWQRRG
jgi:DNA processing protein